MNCFTLYLLIMSDEAVPVIKDNSEYPEWLFTVGAKV